MIFSRLLKNRLTAILFILFIALQTSACGTEEALTAVEPDTGSSTNTNTGDNTSLSTYIKLSWVAPAEREDNSALPLSAIAGYKVYFGTTQGQYSHSVSISDGSATGYTFNDFAAATYYVVVTTIDTEGRESQYSSEVTIVI